MTPEEFRQAGHALIDWIADYRADLESRPRSNRVKHEPVTIERALDGAGFHRRRSHYAPTPRDAVGPDTTTAAAERQMTAIDVEIE